MTATRTATSPTASRVPTDAAGMTGRTIVTPSMYRAHLIKVCAGEAKLVEAARVATNAGKGGPKGKRYRGYFFHQWVGKFVAFVEQTYATDAELQPMCDMLTRAFAK